MDPDVTVQKASQKTRSPKPPRRRWFRYSVRTLLLAVLVLCVWLAVLANRARRQDELVRRLMEQDGATVLYAHEFNTAGNRIVVADPPGPEWLRRITGDHYFFRISLVAANECNDDDLHDLACCHSPESLFLAGRGITDAGLAHVARLKHLKTLHLASMHVTDRGLAHLGKLTSLKNLGLTGPRVTDAGIGNWQDSSACGHLACILPKSPARARRGLSGLCRR